MSSWVLPLILLLLAYCFSVNAANNSTVPASPTTNAEPHWSLQPIKRAQPPKVPNRKWKARNPIDNFIFQELAEKKLSPSPEAPRRTLIRRLYFDLIGLPPTAEEVQAFEQDKSPDAYDRLVEHLLASPQYGERWAQHWLDAVRFAESHGFEMNQPRTNAWRYRDYVIGALNSDKPYNRFIIEQFAGDVFGEDAATGFLVAGPWDQVKSPDPVLTAAQRADELHDMVSTTGSAFLGLTVGCARCHNHKFDPIPQIDYYAIKASLAGVLHGDRKLNTPDLAEREAEAALAKDNLAGVENDLTLFEPIAHTARILKFEPDPSFGSKIAQMLKPATSVRYSEGKDRGERDDSGDLDRMPISTRAYLTFSNSANIDTFAYQPNVEGHFHIWLSWGCGSQAYAADARFRLDRDGDLATTDDQTELAQVDQRRFADGTEAPEGKKLWSGFYDAGSWDLNNASRIVLRGGALQGVATIGILALVEEQPESRLASQTGPSGGGDLATSTAHESDSQTQPARRGSSSFMRSPVNPRRNVERFMPVKGKYLRFTIGRTTDAEPCIDELEVYTAGAHPTNIALAEAGTKASASSVFPNSDLHKLEHLNDGRYGNSRSWISNERGKGWVQLEFTNEVAINRVVWGRDREQQFDDRLTTEYRIEVALTTNEWKLVASSLDRVPYSGGRTSAPDFSIIGLSTADAARVKGLLQERANLEKRIKDLTTYPMAYAGVLTNNPEPTYRLQRGDPMQKREEVQPGVLTAVRFDQAESHRFVTPRSDAELPAANRKIHRQVGLLGSQASEQSASVAKDKLRTNGLFIDSPEQTRFSPSPALEERAERRPLPSVLTDDQKRRLTLANWIADPANPLPARVMVNRLWQHHFGEGIVSTPSDFGKKGAPPTHPELLDWLAAEFISPKVSASKLEPTPTPWSIKHIQRLIVTSSAYRQSSAARPDFMKVDAGARLLWRFPPQRLEAEQLRDSILALSGKLDLRPGGPGFSPFEPNDNYVRVYNPRKEFGPPEFRRMIYMTKVRMQQDSTFGAFDCPDGGQIAPKRMRSTTPLQALNLLNSGFIVQQAGFFAERLEHNTGTNSTAEIRRAFELACGRDPDPQEIKAAAALVQQYGLEMLCRAIFNSNEFLFVE